MTLYGLQRIVAERHRQLNDLGRTFEHDQQHTDNELIWAALFYLDRYAGRVDPAAWPWSDETEPLILREGPDRIRSLVKAGALIAAELDRLVHIKPKPIPGAGPVPAPPPKGWQPYIRTTGAVPGLVVRPTEPPPHRPPPKDGLDLDKPRTWSARCEPGSRWGVYVTFHSGLLCDDAPAWRPTRRWADRYARRGVAKLNRAELRRAERWEVT